MQDMRIIEELIFVWGIPGNEDVEDGATCDILKEIVINIVFPS